MKGSSVQLFNLLSLLKFADLDVRRIALETNMSIRDYFGHLSELIERAPLILNALNKISAFEIDEASVNCLTEMQGVLTTVGHTKLASRIDEISLAVKDGDIAHVAPHAPKISKVFIRLFTQLWTMMISEDADPYGHASMHEAVDKALEELKLEESLRKRRVLAVDDMPVMLTTIGLVLKKEYTVYKLTDPTMLETVLDAIEPELFLLDCEMPKRNGFDLVPAIRNHKLHKETPIIFLTADKTTINVYRAIKLGACDYVVKPIQAEMLRQKVAAQFVKE